MRQCRWSITHFWKWYERASVMEMSIPQCWIATGTRFYRPHFQCNGRAGSGRHNLIADFAATEEFYCYLGSALSYLLYGKCCCNLCWPWRLPRTMRTVSVFCLSWEGGGMIWERWPHCNQSFSLMKDPHCSDVKVHRPSRAEENQ